MISPSFDPLNSEMGSATHREARRLTEGLPKTIAVSKATIDACMARTVQTLIERFVQQEKELPNWLQLNEAQWPSNTVMLPHWISQFSMYDAQAAEGPVQRQALRALIEKGFDARWDINTGGTTPGRTLLHACCHDDLFEALPDAGQAILDRGMPLDVRDGYFGETALLTAVRIGALPCFETLLGLGANPLALSDQGSILWIAASTNKPHSPVILGHLLNDTPAKGLIDAQGSDGLTPLHHAVLHDRVPSVQRLIKHGADPRIKGPDGLNAWDVAHRRGNSEVCRLIDQRWTVLEQEALSATLLDKGGKDLLNTVPRKRL